MYYRIIPFWKSFDTFGLVYTSSQILLPGQIVLIPFGKSTQLWIVYAELSSEEINCDPWNIKEIIQRISEYVFLSIENLELIAYVSEYYITPIHNALWLYFPRNLIEKIEKNTFYKIQEKNYSYSLSQDISLSEKQEDVYRAIQENRRKLWKFLLFWVTGSGKTEIYMKIIEDNLKKWLQTLLLIPEIILTSQIGERITKVFGQDVVLLHSWVSAAKKTQLWYDIQAWWVKVIIGTRSALFYPFKNLGSIIIDEEHDPSYTSENTPRYRSLEVAEFMTRDKPIDLIVASGTPRATTMFRAIQGEFELLQLLEKYK